MLTKREETPSHSKPGSKDPESKDLPDNTASLLPMKTRRRAALTAQTESQGPTVTSNSEYKKLSAQPEHRPPQNIYKKTYPISDAITNPSKTDAAKESSPNGNS